MHISVFDGMRGKVILLHNNTIWHIGGLPLHSRILPAPLAGYSDRAFRDVMREFGCHLVYTEMLSAEGLARHNRQTYNMIDFTDEISPVAVQLFGTSPSSMGEAARIVADMGAAMIDLNSGCPVRKVVRNGAGAALLNTPDLLCAMVREIRRAVSLPLCVKMRIGTAKYPRVALELGPRLADEGADALCLHGRTLEQVFTGKADWSVIGELKAGVGIPVIGNGDVLSGCDARAMVEQTGCDGVMIGRGALGNPWIITECMAALGEIPLNRSHQPTVRERMEMAIRHQEGLVRLKGEDHGIREFRKHAMSYMKGCPFPRQIRARVFHMSTLSEVKEFLTEIAGN